MSKPSNTILIGCDPEMFILDPARDKIISPHLIIPGTKSNPYPVSCGAIQLDGFAAEINIAPAANQQSFHDHIGSVFQEVQKRAAAEKCVISSRSWVHIDQEEFDRAPESSKELGCEPDFDAWTGYANPRPKAEGTLRTAGGHIHVGWTKDMNPFDDDHFEDCRSVVKQLDYYLGLHSLNWDTDKTRRQLYGKLGAFRPKPYGVEYRVLSNAWLFNGNIRTKVFALSLAAINALYKGKALFMKYNDSVQGIFEASPTDWYERYKDIYVDIGQRAWAA